MCNMYMIKGDTPDCYPKNQQAERWGTEWEMNWLYNNSTKILIWQFITGSN